MINQSERRGLTALDRRLQELALMNWTQFAVLIGDEALTAAKICLLRKERRSYGEIMQKLGVTQKTARYWCDECKDREPGTKPAA